ncbi:MAG TPA: Hpt domain-containing protein [Terracidiphilus sp.]|jgi:HPt (histidine-containing phosphotransfer) domain-containing protein|nr:Hpt domain-containing protein [Terracidiphilus sp.]
MASQANPLAEIMNRLWATHLPELEARVTVLETCAQTLRNDEEPATALKEAASAAHKLAGVLGTFGLQRGTDIARSAELACDNFSGDKAALAQSLEAITNELRTLLASKA